MNDEEDLASRIQALTHHQVKNLRIVRSGDQVIVAGQCRTYYVKQLVTQAMIGLYPEANFHNEVTVL